MKMEKDVFFAHLIEYGIFGEGSHISANQNQENSGFSILIGSNWTPFPENTVLYYVFFANVEK